MKKFTNYKIICISFVMTILCILTILLINYGKNVKEIVITPINSENEKVEIIAMNIGGTEYSLEDVNGNNIKYIEDNGILTNANDNKKINFTFSSLEDVKIVFKKNDNVEKIRVNVTSKNYRKDTVINFTNERADYENKITIKEIITLQAKRFYKNIFSYLFIIMVFIIMYFIIYYLNTLINKMQYSNLKLYEVVLTIILTFILFISHIYIAIIYLKFWYSVILLVLLTCLFLKKKNCFKKFENIFLLFSIVLGMGFILIHPPFNVPDEPAHFIKAYSITFNESEKNNYIQKNNTSGASIYINKNVINTISKYINYVTSSSYKLDAKSSLGWFYKNIENDNIIYNFWFGNTATLNIFCYIPAIISIMICRLLNLSVILTSILGRLINFMIFASVMYSIIKNTKVFKKTFMIVGLLPITIEMSAAFSQDSITNTVALLLLASIINIIYDKSKKYSYKDFIITGIASIMIGFCKLVYFPIVLLVALIPKERFKNKKQRWIIPLTIIGITFIISLINIHISNSIGSSGGDYYTKAMMIHQPLHTIKILVNTFFQRCNSDFLTSLVNGYGWSTKWGSFPFLIYIIQSVYLIMYLVANNEEAHNKIINVKHRIAYFIIAGLMLGMIYCALLTGWSSPDTSIVQGLQARYFIPIVPLIIMLLSNNIIKLNLKKDKGHVFYIVMFLVGTFITIFNLIESFYI